MFRRLSFLFAVACALGASVPAARAQNAVCPTAATGDSTNKCASTAFVQNTVQSPASIPAFTGGDVTGPGGSPVLTIVNGAVTNAKLANMLANTIKGATAAGAPADLAIGSCNTANSALIWTPGGGFGCNTIATVGGASVKTANYTLATGDCGATVQYGTGTTGLLTATLPAPAGFANGCTITVKNGDTGRGKILSGFPANVNYILPPLQAVTMQVVNGAFTTLGQAPATWVLPGPTPGANTYTWHVDVAGSDTTADGLGTTTGAFATCQHAIDWVASNVNANQQYIVILVDNGGSCVAPINLKQVAGIYDFWPNKPLVFRGNTSTLPGLNCGASFCIVGLNVQGWVIEGFTFNSSVGYIEADAGAHIYIGTNAGTGNAPVGITCIYAGSLCELIGNWTSLNTAQTNFATVQFGGQFVNAGSNTITLNNAIAYSGFWSASDQGLAVVAGITYAGAGATTSTGATFVLTRGATLATGGKCATTGGSGTNLVGNVAGTAGTFVTGNCS